MVLGCLEALPWQSIVRVKDFPVNSLLICKPLCGLSSCLPSSVLVLSRAPAQPLGKFIAMDLREHLSYFKQEDLCATQRMKHIIKDCPLMGKLPMDSSTQATKANLAPSASSTNQDG